MTTFSWGALALALAALAGIWTWYAFRHRGIASGVRGVALTILPIAAWLTNTLRLFGRIVDAVADWAVRLVFSPTVWVGVALAGLAVLLFLVSLKLPDRRRAARGGPEEAPRQVAPRKQKAGTADGGVGDALGDDAADIEAILRKHGIS